MHSFARSYVLLGFSLLTLLLFSCGHDKNGSSDNRHNVQAETSAPAINPPKSPALNTQNFPPQWEKTPRNACVVGKPFYDTLLAVDPEGAPVTYSLSKGPQGLTLDTQSGVVRFFPKTPGVFSIEVQASDTSQFSTKMEYELTSSAPSVKMPRPKPAVILNVPSVVAPSEQFVIDASKSITNKDPLQKMSFRFDVEGNGTWNIPPGGGFGASPTATHAFISEGVHPIRAQIKCPDGQTAQAACAVIVRERPVARIIVSPESPFVNKPCLLDASKSIVSKTSPGFTVRWDFDNNGTWDYPPNGGYSSEKSVKKLWASPGKYSVVVEIKDGFGASGFATADFVVRAEKPANAPSAPPKPPVVSCGGPYQSHVNKPIDLNGVVKGPDNLIVKYDWDFTGKGLFEWSSPTSGKTRHTYTKSGIYKAVFKVTTNDGKEWRDTTSITIVNTPPHAHAGKPILSKKGRTIKLKGTGEDVDGRIVLYEWDFNGDGTYDWSSAKNGIVKHEFDAYSHAILRVTDSDGATATDTLRVVICPEGMENVENGPYCIDAYEWPNISGKEPEREMTYFDAEKKCLSAGKHLCTSQEWENACMGNERQEYPKSLSPAVQTCNVIGNRYYPNKVAPSGAFPDCKSPVGAYDMNGNVAEWTQGGGVDSAFVYGGSWHHDLGFTNCSSKFPLQKSKGYFYVGFRCCK